MLAQQVQIIRDLGSFYPSLPLVLVLGLHSQSHLHVTIGLLQCSLRICVIGGMKEEETGTKDSASQTSLSGILPNDFLHFTGHF